jgi:hypothetical protein
LIDVIFSTTKDVSPAVDFDEVEAEGNKHEKKIRFHPSNFHDECIDKIQKKLKIPLVKKSRSCFNSSDNSVSVICSISKTHGKSSSPKYWFAFHPYYEDFLKESSSSFMAYGCGSANDILLIPFVELKPLLPDLWTTEKEDRMYYHIVIHRKGDKFFLQVPKKDIMLDISDKKI